MSDTLAHFYHIFGVALKVSHRVVNSVVIRIHILIDGNVRDAPLFKQRGDLFFKNAKIFVILASVADGFKTDRRKDHIPVHDAVALSRIADKVSVSRRADTIFACFRIIENIRLRVYIPVGRSVLRAVVTEVAPSVHIGHP